MRSKIYKLWDILRVKNYNFFPLIFNFLLAWQFLVFKFRYSLHLYRKLIILRSKRVKMGSIFTISDRNLAHLCKFSPKNLKRWALVKMSFPVITCVSMATQALYFETKDSNTLQLIDLGGR